MILAWRIAQENPSKDQEPAVSQTLQTSAVRSNVPYRLPTVKSNVLFRLSEKGQDGAYLLGPLLDVPGGLEPGLR